jgi:cobalt-zinc-cadmium resistance protein CzcA
VNRTIHTVAKNLAEGALFVIAVLFLLLGSIRGGLIVAAAIPFAMLVAFTAMKALGLSGNLMSLGAIDFGIVVDGSIIVVENAVVHLAAAARGQKRPMTYNEAADVVLNSTLDVRKAALFGEAIIVIVYIPILTLAGIEGKMFKPMAITVLFALLGAFVASLTFVPVLVATFLRQHTEEKEPFIVRLLHRVYPRLLAPLMKAPKKVIAVSLVLLVARASWPRAWGRSSCRGSTRAPSPSRSAAAERLARGERARARRASSGCCVSSPRSSPWSRRPAEPRSRPTPWAWSCRTSS